MTAATPSARFDERGFVVPDGCDSVVDVLFDGRRIWSFSPADARTSRFGPDRIEWPEVLVPRLHGVATVQLRNHVSGEVVLTEEVVFGDGEGPVRIEDAEGRPVAVTKWGRLNHPFDATDRSAIEGYLDQVEEVLAVLRDECGLPGFLSYGSLLGAVRTGRMIGHDVDVDIGYLSAADHPADVLLESFAVERTLRSHGWEIRRENGGFLALFLPQSDGTMRNLDVFTCFCVDDHVLQVHDTRMPGDRSLVEPLSSVPFEGRRLPAPAEPEKFLETAYGPGWRVPDPAFEFHTPRATARRISGWLGGFRDERDRWDDFYRRRGDEVPVDASGFAAWVLPQAEELGAATVFDLGCGNGRDAVHLAEHGFDVVAVDFSEPALRRTRRLARQRRQQSGRSDAVAVTTLRWNLNSLRESLLHGSTLARQPGPGVVYARFLLHALHDHARSQFWVATSMLAAGGGRAYLEFRTPRDRDRHKAFGRHFRRYLDPDRVVAEAEQHGATVLDRVEGRGLAELGQEDAHVCRLALGWEP